MCLQTVEYGCDDELMYVVVFVFDELMLCVVFDELMLCIVFDELMLLFLMN